MKGTRTIALLLTLVLCMLCLFGCSGEAAQTSATTTAGGNATTATSTEKAKANMYGWTVPKDKKTIEVFIGGKTATDLEEDGKLLDQYLLNHFNIEWKSIGSDLSKTEQLNLYLASTDYPDVLVSLSSSQIAAWTDVNKLVDLNAYVDQYGSNIKAALSDFWWYYQNKDGAVYALPRGYGSSPEPDLAACLRYDYWKEIGSPELKSTTDYYQAVNKVLAAHPKTSSGKNVYALSWNEDCTVSDVQGFWGFRDGYQVGADNSLTHWMNTDLGLEMVLWFNQFSIDGTWDPDAFTQDYDAFKEKFSNEQVTGFIGQWWMTYNAGHELWMETLPTYTDDMRYVQFEVKSDNTKQAYLNNRNPYGTSFWCVTNSCKNVEDVMTFFDWASTEKGMQLFFWGIPNEKDSAWTLKDDGTWSMNQKIYDEMAAGGINFTKLNTLGLQCYTLMYNRDYFSDGKSNIYLNTCKDVTAKSQWEQWKMNYCSKDSFWNSALFAVQYGVDSEEIIINQKVDDILKTAWVDMITAPSASICKEKYQKYQKELNDAGLEKLTVYRTAAYKEMLAK